MSDDEDVLDWLRDIYERVRRGDDRRYVPRAEISKRIHAEAEVQRLVAELALKDQALDEIKEQARRWLKIASTAGGPEDVAYNEGLRDCQGDIARILTRLDTQGETK